MFTIPLATYNDALKQLLQDSRASGTVLRRSAAQSIGDLTPAVAELIGLGGWKGKRTPIQSYVDKEDLIVKAQKKRSAVVVEERDAHVGAGANVGAGACTGTAT